MKSTISDKNYLARYKRYLLLLSHKDRKKVFYIAVIQFLTSFLDLLGVIIIGLIGSLAVSGIQSSSSPESSILLLKKVHLDGYSFQVQIGILSFFAVAVLLGKTLFSLYFTRKIIAFFSIKAAELSTKMISSLLNSSLSKIQQKSVQENLYALTTGVEVIMLQILATILVVISDLSLLLLLITTLFIVDQVTTLITFLIFAVIGFAMYKKMHRKARELGNLSSSLTILSSSGIVESLSSYREIFVSDKRDYYAENLSATRYKIANARAQINFMPYISKYVVEFSVVIISIIIGAIQFILNDSISAVSTIGIFLAAGTRIAPALLRIQQGMIAISTSQGQAAPTISLIESLKDDKLNVSIKTTRKSGEQFVPMVQLKNVSFSYPDSEQLSLKQVNLVIEPGSMVAIVGPSGSGKTTLIDVLLGLLPASEGSVLISDLPPEAAVKTWPGLIAYVPQDVFLSDSTIRQNIAIGVGVDKISDQRVMECLDSSAMSEVVKSLSKGIYSFVGENGSKLSVGQRQRIGIARALYSEPQIIVLDEATSSLDAETEEIISQALQNLRGERTLIVVAHRLSTIQNADLVVYVEKGQILASGSFSEVRKIVPNFELQAQLLGL
jgi:ABC-type multidrug transport system fused ATPase/permease subunit